MADNGGDGVPPATIIVVGWRSAPHLQRCLDSIATNVPTHLRRVSVVLNEPSDALQAQLAGSSLDMTITAFRTNLGFGAAVNVAADQADTEFLVLLNDDCIVQPGWLEALLDTARRRPRAGAVGSRFLHMDGTLQEAGSVLWSDGTTWAAGDGGDVRSWEFERQVEYCSGGALLVRVSAWREAGGMDEIYYPAYYEDLDLALRLRAVGWETWLGVLSTVLHTRGASSVESFRTFISERNRRTFRERWSEVLADREPVGQMERAVWRSMGEPSRVLVIDDVIPQGQMGSGFGRARDMLVELSSDDAIHVALFPRLGTDGDHDDLARMGVRIIGDLDTHLADPTVCYDTVIISRPHNGEIFFKRIRDRFPDATLVYDAEALYHRRMDMQAAMTDDPVAAAALKRQARAMRETEYRLVSDADAVVCISEDEAALVRAQTTARVVVVSPLLSEPTATESGFDTRHDIGFVAGWLAGPGSPNCDALLWFSREVLPLVQAEVPGCRLLVTGARPPSDVRWLHGADVVFTGLVSDLRAFYAGIRVAISPVRFGAGVKLKTIEAAQFGVPVVATTEGAAGLDGDWSSALCIADDPGEFAQCVIDLLGNPATWSRRRLRGLELVDQMRERGKATQMWQDVVRVRPAAAGEVAS